MKRVVDNLTDIFKALSDKTRLRILGILVRANCEMCVCEIMDTVKESQYNVSRHLKVLKYAGLVREHKDGRFVYYSVTKSGDKVHKIIWELFSTISGDIFDDDAQRLKKRLALHKNSKWITGMYNKKSYKDRR
jgi:ArsR family transcriptional regulator